MLVPTRELALQTSAIVKEIGKHTGVQCMVSMRLEGGRENSRGEKPSCAAALLLVVARCPI